MIAGKYLVDIFFIDGLSGEERCNVINECIIRLHKTGVIVSSLTCDGPACNLAMIRALGCNIDPFSPHFRPSFQHPCEPLEQIHIILDPCHMIKLVRNCLGDLRILHDDSEIPICWSHITALYHLQKTEGLRLGNKLTSAHIEWPKQKMKVNIAAQTLSSSVADALCYCRNELKINTFSDCSSLIKFNRVFDRLFDALISRNMFAKGQKAAIRKSNVHVWKPILDEARQYIFCLRDNKGNSILKSNRKTGFIGFLCCINSVMALFEKLVAPINSPLKYILTYKLSQDHIELFLQL